MREDLWQQKTEDSGQDNSRIPRDPRAQYLLEDSRPGTVTQLKPLLKQLKTRISKEVGRSPLNVVVGVPIYTSNARRREIRSAISTLDLAITVLTTSRQGPLSTYTFDLHNSARYQEHTVLMIEYNHASVDIAIANLGNRAIDVMGHTSWPFLGEDYLMLKLASLSLDHPVTRHDHRILRERALQSKGDRELPTDTPLLNAPEYSSVESAHFEAIIHKITSMVEEHTYPEGTPRNKMPWKPRVDDLSHVLISGDASSQSFASLRKALQSNERLAKLIDPGRNTSAPTPAWISAEGAAKEVKERLYFDEMDGEPFWIVHQEL